MRQKSSLRRFHPITGPTTGCMRANVEEIRLDLKPVGKVVKGDLCSIPIKTTLRRSDRLYTFK